MHCTNKHRSPKPDALIECVHEALIGFQEKRRETHGLFPCGDNIYPIPFFGNILQAEVLTLALNPARNEFDNDRNWPTGLDARGLADRLLEYFDLGEAEPHSFFTKCHPALSLLGRSYEHDAAHVDLLPHPTLFRGEMGEQQRMLFAALVASISEEHLKSVLQFCRGVKLILVIDYDFAMTDGGTTQTFEFLASHIPVLATKLKGHGDLPPIFRGGGIGQLTQRVRDRRRELRDCLQRGSILEF